jgi:hypothetical protein
MYLSMSCHLISSPHLLVLATSERFLPARGIFRAILASESRVGTLRSLVASTSRCGEGITTFWWCARMWRALDMGH